MNQKETDESGQEQGRQYSDQYGYQIAFSAAPHARQWRQSWHTSSPYALACPRNRYKTHFSQEYEASDLDYPWSQKYRQRRNRSSDCWDKRRTRLGPRTPPRLPSQALPSHQIPIIEMPSRQNLTGFSPILHELLQLVSVFTGSPTPDQNWPNPHLYSSE